MMQNSCTLNTEIKQVALLYVHQWAFLREECNLRLKGSMLGLRAKHPPFIPYIAQKEIFYAIYSMKGWPFLFNSACPFAPFACSTTMPRESQKDSTLPLSIILFSFIHSNLFKSTTHDQQLPYCWVV